MTRTKTHPSWLAVVAAAALLAGCATTDSTYSSLPPAPEHPGPKAPMDRATVTIPGSFSTAREVPHMPPEQYTDLLDRIRDGYALPDVAHYAVDREVELYRKNPDFLDRTFKRGCALPVLHRAGTRAAQPPARTRAAAGRRKRVQSGRLFAQPRLGPVAVHPVLGQALRPRAELVDRRASRRHRSHGRRAHLPAVPQHVFRRRLVPRDRGLQRRRRHRQRRGASQPVGGIADGLLQPEPACRNPRLRAEAARHQPHRA